MSKIFSVVVYVVAVFGTASSGYLYWQSKSCVANSELAPTTAQVTPPPSSQRSPLPNHGDFENRFEPTPPPPNGGNLK